MPPLHHTRRSRRLSRKSPVQVSDYDWQGAAPLQLFHSGSDVEITPPAIHPLPPSPSTCTTNSSDSPPAIVTHLPFTPGTSHTRNRKEGHIPRPPNAFMVFRSWLWNKDNLKSIERDNRNVSRIAGRYWNELSEAERAPFRSMAEEAKARHAQLYPEYRYSPGSQKKPKVAQRRSHRSTEVENDKCNKVADLLLCGVTSRDLAKRLGEAHQNVQSDQGAVEGMPSQPPNAVTRNKPKRHVEPHGESPVPQPRSKKQKTLLPPPPISTPLLQYPGFPSRPSATEERSEPAPTPDVLTRTPELVYPGDNAEVFVTTDDIPLSLPRHPQRYDVDFHTFFPSHLKPAAYSVFSGVKPEASLFVDSCMLGAYTADPMAFTSAPFNDFDIGSYSILDSELVPLGSPVFSNPFDPSTPTAEQAALLGTLDQLFGQPISPLTTENW
ncbi:hypothetical protein JVT61DRAFT_9349 [Boletus reticuloceps]|uniref:HMG box domain-containing protein n=1 Tax=Boletus reticuloceps TaxID=495285 RepID=A0A8I2YGR8_9AGAM|nr:hypothetical protein JVT61DRAFT_9349 [Boletus reticuloceps]